MSADNKGGAAVYRSFESTLDRDYTIGRAAEHTFGVDLRIVFQKDDGVKVPKVFEPFFLEKTRVYLTEASSKTSSVFEGRGG